MLIGLVACFSAQAQSPTWEEWFRQKRTQRKYLIQQIAALKIYLEYLKKGYDIAEKGLTTIGDIKNGTFNLDKDYFNSLKLVNPVIRDSPKVNEILLYQNSIQRDFRVLMQGIQSDENLQASEVSYIQSVYQKMLVECDASIDELILISTVGETEMKDDERLLRLDRVHEDMIDKYAFTQDFIAGTRMFSLQRAKERSDIKTSESLFNEL